MDTGLRHDGVIGLNPGSTLRLRDAVGLHIGVVGGTVWITQEKDSRDHVLSAGESFRFDHAGLTLVMPLEGKAQLVLEDGLAPEPSAQSPASARPDNGRFVPTEYYEQQARRLRAEAMGQIFEKPARGLKRIGSAVGRLIAALRWVSEESAVKRLKL